MGISRSLTATNSMIRVLLQSGMILVVRILVLIWIGPFIPNQDTKLKRVLNTRLQTSKYWTLMNPGVGHLDLEQTMIVIMRRHILEHFTYRTESFLRG